MKIISNLTEGREILTIDDFSIGAVIEFQHADFIGNAYLIIGDDSCVVSLNHGEEGELIHIDDNELRNVQVRELECEVKISTKN